MIIGVSHVSACCEIHIGNLSFMNPDEDPDRLCGLLPLAMNKFDICGQQSIREFINEAELLF